MVEIAIGYLQHRRNYSGLFTYLLDKLKPENKKLCKIYFLTTGQPNLDIQTNIDSQVIQFGQYGALPGQPYEHINNFENKINTLADIPCKYVIRTGEDVFVNPHVLDYIIENRYLLDDKNNLALIPCENIGVPTCDLFMDGFSTPEERIQIQKMFLGIDIYETAGKRWGRPELQELNNYTIRATTWQLEAFLQPIYKFQFETRGIHPVRFDAAIQRYMCELVINNIDRFLCQRNYNIIIPQIPHTCDNFCMCLQETFNDVRKEFPFKPYEEFSMNKYMCKHQSKCLWIQNGFAYTDVYAFVSRHDPKFHDAWNKEDLDRYTRLFINCKKYYENILCNH